MIHLIERHSPIKGYVKLILSFYKQIIFSSFLLFLPLKSRKGEEDSTCFRLSSLTYNKGVRRCATVDLQSTNAVTEGALKSTVSVFVN